MKIHVVSHTLKQTTHKLIFVLGENITKLKENLFIIHSTTINKQSDKCQHREKLVGQIPTSKIRTNAAPPIAANVYF